MDSTLEFCDVCQEDRPSVEWSYGGDRFWGYACERCRKTPGGPLAKTNAEVRVQVDDLMELIVETGRSMAKKPRPTHLRLVK